MEFTMGIVIFIIFIVVAVLMSRDTVPSAIAIPLMAIAIAIAGGGSLSEILDTVIAAGASRLASSIIIVVFSVWLGRVLIETGIAENIIRKAAEYAGDRPLLLALLVSAASAFILTGIRGLGALILVGTIALPIMLSVGIPNIVAGCLLLLAYATGNLINLGTWGIFGGIFEQDVATIAPFVFTLTAFMALVIVVFAVVQLRRVGLAKFAGETERPARTYEQVPLVSLLTPAVPLVFVMGFKWGIIPSILVGIVYALVTTGLRRNIRQSFNLLQRAMFEGFKDAAPAATLMIGIGMLLAAIALPGVANGLAPIFDALVPHGILGYVIFFTLAMPFVLYRGPFNMWGMGAGLVLLIMATGYFRPEAIMAAFMAGAAVQQAVEPTNTHNVWTAAYTDTTVTEILRKTLAPTWIAAAAGIVLAAVLYVL